MRQDVNGLFLEAEGGGEGVSLLDSNRAPQMLGDVAKRRQIEQSVAALIKAKKITAMAAINGTFAMVEIFGVLLFLTSKLTQLIYYFEFLHQIKSQACTPNATLFSNSSLRSDFLSICFAANTSGLLDLSNPKCNVSSMPEFCHEIIQTKEKQIMANTISWSDVEIVVILVFIQAVIYAINWAIVRCQRPDWDLDMFGCPTTTPIDMYEVDQNLAFLRANFDIAADMQGYDKKYKEISDVLAQVFIADPTLKPISLWGKLSSCLLGSKRSDSHLEEISSARTAINNMEARV